MKEFIKNLFLNILISYFVLSIFKGIALPSNEVYLIATLVIFSFGLLIASPLINFLTVRENFMTRFVMSSLISIGFLFLLKIFMIDFEISSYTFEGLNMGNVVINSFDITPIIAIVFVGILSSFISSTFFVLEKSR